MLGSFFRPRTPQKKSRDAASEITAADRIAKCAEEKKIFDVHCHYFSYLQQTEGIETLAECMDKCGMGYAALAGCAFKKTWMSTKEKMPEHHLYE